MVKQNEEASTPATEREIAPATAIAEAPVPAPVAFLPRNLEIERQGDVSAAYSFRFPEVRGGICEFCGVMDGNFPSEFQYKLCPHYRGKQLRCSYCPAEKNPDEVINHSVLRVATHPDNPRKLVVWCDSFDCSKKHRERFEKSGS